MDPRTDPFGLLAFLHWNHPWNKFHFNDQILPKALKQLKELGISFVRLDILWSDVHAGSLKYKFDRYDRLLREVHEQGINILAVLHYNKVDREGSAVLWNRPPDSFEEFAAYVGATVNRYKGFIHHWEIWNEPNLAIYWDGPRDGLRLYSSLLKKSYVAAKEVDPSCVVLNGGLTEPILSDIEHLYLNGMKNYFDALNIHIFLAPDSPHALNRFKEILDGVNAVQAKYKDETKPIWITEAGCPGIPMDKRDMKWFAGGFVSEEGQAKWLEKIYGLMKEEPQVQKLFWAFYRDTDDQFHDGTDYFGLVRSDLSPKPAFNKLKSLIEKKG
jgi:polysaccharide biosynthesis protein PslG